MRPAEAERSKVPNPSGSQPVTLFAAAGVVLEARDLGGRGLIQEGTQPPPLSIKFDDVSTLGGVRKGPGAWVGLCPGLGPLRDPEPKIERLPGQPDGS